MINQCDKDQRLGLFEINVDGKDFFCHRSTRQDFVNYINQIVKDNVTVVFLYTITYQKKYLKKDKQRAAVEKEQVVANNYTNYKATVSKQRALEIFDYLAKRSTTFSEMILNSAIKKFDKNARRFMDKILNKKL